MRGFFFCDGLEKSNSNGGFEGEAVARISLSYWLQALENNSIDYQ
jgi:hypothetical protein